MYGLLHAGVQFGMSRVRKFPPALVSMKMSFAAWTALRIPYARGVGTTPSIASTLSWSMNFCVFWIPVAVTLASSS